VVEIPVPGLESTSTRRFRTPRWQRWISPIVILLLWQLADTLHVVNEQIVPAPSTVFLAWHEWFLGSRSALSWSSGTWLPDTLLSVRRVAIGFAIAACLGIPLGLMIGWSRKVADLAGPLVQILRPIPITAWLPFAAAIFGIRESAAIFLISFGAFFPIVVSCVSGAEQVPLTLIRAARMLGTPRHKLLWRVALPSALPFIVAGLRLGLSLSWMLVIVAEMLAVKGGLGYAMWSAYEYLRMDYVIVAMFTLAVLGTLTDRGLVLLTSRLLHWSHRPIEQHP